MTAENPDATQSNDTDVPYSGISPAIDSLPVLELAARDEVDEHTVVIHGRVKTSPIQIGEGTRNAAAAKAVGKMLRNLRKSAANPLET